MQSDPKLFESLFNPPLHTNTHVHPPLNTESYWKETRCYLTKTCWRQCVYGSGGQGGIVDTLLPYVHPGCSPSAGLMSANFLPKFLQGNWSVAITDGRWLHRLEWMCVSPELSGA